MHEMNSNHENKMLNYIMHIRYTKAGLMFWLVKNQMSQINVLGCFKHERNKTDMNN